MWNFPWIFFFSLEKYWELYKVTQVLNHSIVIHRFHRLQDATLFVFHLNTPSMETWNSEWCWDFIPLIVYLALQLPSFWAFHQHDVPFRIISSLYFSRIIFTEFFFKRMIYDIWIWLKCVNWRKRFNICKEDLMTMIIFCKMIIFNK